MNAVRQTSVAEKDVIEGVQHKTRLTDHRLCINAGFMHNSWQRDSAEEENSVLDTHEKQSTRTIQYSRRVLRIRKGNAQTKELKIKPDFPFMQII